MGVLNYGYHLIAQEMATAGIWCLDVDCVYVRAIAVLQWTTAIYLCLEKRKRDAAPTKGRLARPLNKVHKCP